MVDDCRSARNEISVAMSSVTDLNTETKAPKRVHFEQKPSVVKRLASDSQELGRLASLPDPRRILPRQSARIKEANSSSASDALKGLKFISTTDGRVLWKPIETLFDDITKTTSGLLHRSQFGKCIGMNSEGFALELFDALARRRHIKGEEINKEQLAEFWEQISDQRFDSRLQIFFDIVDKDGDGRLTEEEVKKIIILSASANKLSNIQKRADEYAALIMEELDPDNMGYIMLESFEKLLSQASTQTKTISEHTQMPNQETNATQPSYSVRLQRWCLQTGYSILDNWQRVWFMALWFGVMAVLFTYKYVQYKNREVYQVLGACVCVAKGAAEILKLNMALILLPVCRNTITWLRNKTSLGTLVPFDDNINFHMVIAGGITVGVGMHAIAHLACDFPRILSASEDAYNPLRKFFGEQQPESYWHFVKSVEGVTGIIMILLMSIAFTLATPWFRRGTLIKLLTSLKKRVLRLLKKPVPNPLTKPIPGPSKKRFRDHLKKLASFNAFWYSHHLFIIVYILLIVHGVFLYLTHEWYKKTTWMYVAAPVILYACERLIRAFRSSIKAVTVEKVALYSGGVLCLHLSKPPGFRCKSGQYMFVKCSAVSPFEWHPFSITSAPQDDYLRVHIKALGDWTKALRELFSNACKAPLVGVDGLRDVDMLYGANNPKMPKIEIDGPYGAPSQEYKDYEVLLLVGLGIGATPMISILRDIVNNIKARDDAETERMESGSSDSGQQEGSNFKTKKAYFYWATREQGTFNWFKNIMNEVAERDHNHVIELHNHCTSVFEEDDARSAFISTLQKLNYAKHGVDVVSGTRVMSHFAKPDWRNVYDRIAKDHPNTTVGVFYCGSPALTKTLRRLAREFTHKTNTKFAFHKENF